VVRLLLIRHGQTPSNVLGQLDTAIPGPGLTELGERQAAALPSVLGVEQIAAIYVSQLTRTHLTAAPLAAARGLEPIELSGTHEIQAGDLEMRSDWPSVRQYLGTMLAWGTGEPERRMPGGETGTEFLARFDAGIAEVQAQHPDETVAVFSHGAAMRLWTQVRTRNIDDDFTVHVELDNTGIVVLEGGILDDGGRGFELIEWRGTAAAGLVDESADDVTGDPVDEQFAEGD
jgi:probable phosphoglycerate mutase